MPAKESLFALGWMGRQAGSGKSEDLPWYHLHCSFREKSAGWSHRFYYTLVALFDCFASFSAGCCKTRIWAEQKATYLKLVQLPSSGCWQVRCTSWLSRFQTKHCAPLPSPMCGDSNHKTAHAILPPTRWHGCSFRAHPSTSCFRLLHRYL